MNAKQYPKKKLKTERESSHKRITDKRKSNNVQVLRPQVKQKTRERSRTQARTKVNYGRIILFISIIMFIFWAVKPLLPRIEQKQEQVKFEKQLSNIKQENKQLYEELTYLKSNDYVEQKARSLGLSKPDEEVIVVVPQSKKETLKGKQNKAEIIDEKKVPDSLWSQVVDVVSNIF